MRHCIIFVMSVILIGLMTFFAYYVGMRHQFTDIIKPLAAFSSALFLSFLLENTKYRLFKIFARIIYIFLCLLLVFLFFIFIYYFNIGKSIEHQDIIAVLQTDKTEALAYFIRHFASSISIFTALSIFLVSLYTFINFGSALLNYVNIIKLLYIDRVKNLYVGKINPACMKKIISLSYALFTASVLIFFLIASAKITTIKVIIHDVKNYKILIKEFHEVVHSASGQDIAFTHQSRGEVHVLIIGESASRNFMQIYVPNPLLPKTPCIESISSRKNAVLFNNAYAFTNATVGTLCSAFSDGRTLTGLTFPKGENIISTARAAGFKTIWLSNQAPLGEFENPISALAYHADETIYINQSSVDNFTKTRLDGELVPFFSQIMQERDRGQNYIIFVHLMGSHSPYSSRVPGGITSFDIHSRAKLGKLVDNKKRLEHFNLYLESLEYSDSVIGELFEIASVPERKVSSFVYFSDHGEDLFTLDGEHRTVTGATWSVMRVPFFVWLSEEYAARHPEKLKSLKANKNKVFTNDLIYDLMLGLSGTKTRGYSSSFDVSSADYSLNLENARTNLSAVKDEAYYTIKETLSLVGGQFQLGATHVDSIFKVWLLHDFGVNFFGLAAKVMNNELVILDARNEPLDLPADQFVALFPDGVTVYLDMSGTLAKDSGIIISTVNGLSRSGREFIVGASEPELVEILAASGIAASYIVQSFDNDEKIARAISRYDLSMLSFTDDNFKSFVESPPADSAALKNILIIDSRAALDDKDIYSNLGKYMGGKARYVLVPFKSQYDSY